MKKLCTILAAVYCLFALAACAPADESAPVSTQTDATQSTSQSESRPDSSQSASTASSASSSSSSSRPSGSSGSVSGAPSSSPTQPPATSRPTASSSTPGAQTPAPATPSPTTPAPSSQPAPPAPPPPDPPAPQPSGPYAYPFDVGQIQSDMIAWGQAAGMTHEAGARTPDNSSWDNPITASESFQGDILKQKLQEYVQFYTSASWQGYGNEPVSHFTIYVSGTTFYVLH